MLLAVALLYRKVVRLWWIWDDTYLIHIATEHRFIDSFVDRSLWLTMPQHLFTPLLTASYAAELAVFGPNPVAFYAVHLFELAAVAIALGFALRLWMSRAAAAGAALLFLVGTPVAVVAAQLMLMHYVESIALSIGSAALFSHWLSVVGSQLSTTDHRQPTTIYEAMRRGRTLPAVLSGVLYLLAMLAKEIAVPLPVVLLVLPERDPRARLRGLVPHAAALIVYLAWRYAILGELLGGYGWTFGAGGAPSLLRATGARLLHTLAGPQLGIGVAFLLLLLCGIVLRLRTRASVVAVFVAFAAAVLPILPVAAHYENRFAIGAWLCAAIVFAAGVDTLRRRRLAAALLIAAPLLGLLVNRQQWKSEFNLAKRMSDEGRVFAAINPDDVLRAPAIPPGEMYQLAWFKVFMLHRPSGTAWFFDDLFLCSGRRPPRVFGFDEQTREVREITAEIDGIARRYCASIRPGEPLQLHFRFQHSRHLLTWELGPYADGGKYRIVTGDGFNAYDVQPRDSLQLFGEYTFAFRACYRSPQGWVTYSPEFSLDLSRDQDLRWRR